MNYIYRRFLFEKQERNRRIEKIKHKISYPVCVLSNIARDKMRPNISYYGHHS